jgi:RNAse (barnase) inhibitor barstar
MLLRDTVSISGTGCGAGSLGERGARMAKAVYEIDGRDFSTLEEFYEVVSRVLIPGATWGRNLDAFNDILRGGFGTAEGGFVLRWKNSAVSRERLGYPETVRQLEHRLTRCHPSNRKWVGEDLKRAQQGVGPSVFDWLIEIIQVHGAGGQEQDDGVELNLE